MRSVICKQCSTHNKIQMSSHRYITSRQVCNITIKRLSQLSPVSIHHSTLGREVEFTSLNSTTRVEIRYQPITHVISIQDVGNRARKWCLVDHKEPLQSRTNNSWRLPRHHNSQIITIQRAPTAKDKETRYIYMTNRIQGIGICHQPMPCSQHQPRACSKEYAKNHSRLWFALPRCRNNSIRTIKA